jgi:hypothetical protein
MKYKDIPNFEGLYQVSDTGIIKALKRIVKMPNGGVKEIKEHYPKLSITKKGYLKVMLTNKKGIRKGRFVHRLVALCFISKSKLQVNHKDENKQNNNVDNLEYVRNRQNVIYSIDKTKTSSKYVGVTKQRNKWQCQKMINGKRTYLGLFDTPEQARNKYLES